MRFTKYLLETTDFRGNVGHSIAIQGQYSRLESFPRGPGMKYFCFLNSQRQDTLSQAEVMMRHTYAQKADLRYGKSNLDLRYGQS